MSFFASLCCSSGDRSSTAAEETRRARIIAATATNRPRRPSIGSPTQRSLYPESPPEYKDIVEQPLVSIDEKKAIDFQITVQDEDDLPPPPSPRSSVISIPSTRLTDLTAAQTGGTTRTSRRESLELVSTRESLPPYSYYSRRSASPASSAAPTGEGERDEVWLHPVMSGNWLEVLQYEHIVQISSQRNPHGQSGNGT